MVILKILWKACFTYGCFDVSLFFDLAARSQRIGGVSFLF